MGPASRLRRFVLQFHYGFCSLPFSLWTWLGPYWFFSESRRFELFRESLRRTRWIFITCPTPTALLLRYCGRWQQSCSANPCLACERGEQRLGSDSPCSRIGFWTCWCTGPTS